MGTFFNAQQSSLTIPSAIALCAKDGMHQSWRQIISFMNRGIEYGRTKRVPQDCRTTILETSRRARGSSKAPAAGVVPSPPP